ncbi:superinfection immunity protein [Actinomadura gamaensis]|uniref:Superinfection immunity protein n=1 Tax=Actinomadura gamaensis TaxID=1763541 RepID=A0ABV9TWS8_9ACTN
MPIYLLPPVIAFYRRAELRWVVLPLTLFFGATFIGWMIAMFLAFRNPGAGRRRSTGGATFR